MIIGIGTDIAEVKRIEKACRRTSFREKIFTLKEIEQAGGNIIKLAGDFAVKEAVAKVFGTGFRGFMPGDIEVLRNDLGKPYVVLYGGALQQYNRIQIKNLQVTISNSEEYAVAFAIGEG